MVLINLKTTLSSGATDDNNSNDEFLYETKLSTKVDDLIESLVNIHNARVRSHFIIITVKELATYGVARRHDDGGGGEDDDQKIGDSTDEESNYLVDPSGLRMGPPPDAHLAEMLINEVDSLGEYIDKKHVANKVPITLESIEEKIDIIRTIVSKAYPMGLPEWELVKSALYDPIDKFREKKLGGRTLVDANDASLWTCNKEFIRGQLVSDRLGSSHNEKTKIIVKLTTKAAGPPVREPIVSEAERHAMAAFYFKRQEELKTLAQADEDDYLNSQWADPKGMRRNLQGLSDVKTPGELSRLKL